jgi:hypothetical protein
MCCSEYGNELWDCIKGRQFYNHLDHHYFLRNKSVPRSFTFNLLCTNAGLMQKKHAYLLILAGHRTYHLLCCSFDSSCTCAAHLTYSLIMDAPKGRPFSSLSLQLSLYGGKLKDEPKKISARRSLFFALNRSREGVCCWTRQNNVRLSVTSYKEQWFSGL